MDMDKMSIASPAFEENGVVPTKYTCDGEDINPPLLIYGVPKETLSLVLIMEDPDVPKNLREDGMWNHWVVFNIPPDVREIQEGKNPPGILGRGTGENLSYKGPCPPDREHRYFFKVLALDVLLNLSEGSTKEEVLKGTEGHILDSAELVGRYNRRIV